MIPFSPADPFPLVSVGECSYEDEKQHAEQVDAWLGLETAKVEDAIKKRMNAEAPIERPRDREFWVGLAPQSLSTPYTEIRRLLERLKIQPGETLVDIGAGYGRIGHVLARHFSSSNFTGFEFVHERVEAGNDSYAKAGVINAKLIEADTAATTFVLPRAEFYFLYDFGSRQDIEKTLLDLKEHARGNSFAVIGRGGRVQDLIEKNHPWLAGVVAPERAERYSIFRTA